MEGDVVVVDGSIAIRVDAVAELVVCRGEGLVLTGAPDSRVAVLGSAVTRPDIERGGRAVVAELREGIAGEGLVDESVAVIVDVVADLHHALVFRSARVGRAVCIARGEALDLSDTARADTVTGRVDGLRLVEVVLVAVGIAVVVLVVADLRLALILATDGIRGTRGDARGEE